MAAMSQMIGVARAGGTRRHRNMADKPTSGGCSITARVLFDRRISRSTAPVDSAGGEGSLSNRDRGEA